MSVCSCACLEVSFKLKHEKQVISINCRLSRGLGVAAPLRKDIQTEGKEHEKENPQSTMLHLGAAGRKMRLD